MPGKTGVLNFQGCKGFRIWCISKKELFGKCKDKKIVDYQGKQGWWCDKNKIINHLTEIENIDELDKFIESTK